MARRGSGMLFLGAALVLGARAQSTRTKDLAAGRLLVASRDLGDPDFMRTVVLLLECEERGAMGLIINRRTNTPVSRILTLKEAKGRPDSIYAGGPVQIASVLALARMSNPPENAVHVTGDVYVIDSKSTLAGLMKSSAGEEKFRVYMGYAGWGFQQLQREVELGAWRIVPGDAGAVFDPDPDTLWTRVFEKANVRIAVRGGTRVPVSR